MPPERFADRTAFNIPCLGDRLTYSFELLPVALLRSEIKFITMGEHQKKQVLFCFRLNKRLHRLLLSRKPSEIPPIIEDTARELCKKVREAKKTTRGIPMSKK